MSYEPAVCLILLTTDGGNEMRRKSDIHKWAVLYRARNKAPSELSDEALLDYEAARWMEGWTPDHPAAFDLIESAWKLAPYDPWIAKDVIYLAIGTGKPAVAKRVAIEMALRTSNPTERLDWLTQGRAQYPEMVAAAKEQHGPDGAPNLDNSRRVEISDSPQSERPPRGRCSRRSRTASGSLRIGQTHA